MDEQTNGWTEGQMDRQNMKLFFVVRRDRWNLREPSHGFCRMVYLVSFHPANDVEVRGVGYPPVDHQHLAINHGGQRQPAEHLLQKLQDLLAVNLWKECFLNFASGDKIGTQSGERMVEHRQPTECAVVGSYHV